MTSPNKALAALVQKAGVGKQRSGDRSKAVLPVRISGNDVSGTAYSELVHTLDVSRTGVRLGSVRRQLEVGSLVVLQYRQHKAEFRVVWTKPVGSGTEQQVGLESGAQRDLWGLDATPANRPQSAAPEPSNHASAGA
ncbi:MAG: PilZ domain-containing protein [Terriglobales bacterium]